ncbi:MAG: riboflavin biosynthesis protein RibF [Oscillospiraceae bacterium]|nr:riboflavin biosynthesis protein RibF [Oscillospiraceae bacterium]
MREYTRPTAVALGVFDGVHLGHRAVLNAVYELSQKKGRLACAFAFRTEDMISVKSSSGYLYPSAVRKRIMHQSGIQHICAPAFSNIKNMDGRTFAKEILYGKLYAKDVCCGKNFRFGEHASCNVQDLEQFGKWFGFRVHVIDDVLKDGVKISSTEIRKLLLNGEIEKANAFLGQPYQIWQEVTHGAQLGRTIGFPTINQMFQENQLVPKFGVYASETQLADGRKFKSLTNIGMKPTVNYQGLPLAETYIEGFSGDLYEKWPSVNLLRFIRPEMKFDSVQALTEQMTKDLQS